MLRLALAALVVAPLAAFSPALTPDPDPATVTFSNGTGMAITAIHMARCGESEGNDWADMASWTYDYLDDGPLAPDASTEVQIVEGCFVVLPIYEGFDQHVSEQIQVEDGMRHWFTLG